jgi:hypothetical protein
MSESGASRTSNLGLLKKKVSELFTPPQTDIPENILAFRTITTLLERIQQHKPFKLLQNEQEDPEQDLKLATAFSTVAVIQHEIVAVVANRMPETLKVIVTSNTISPDQNQQVIPQSIFPDLSSFLFVKNFRKDDLKSAEFQKTLNSDPVIHPLQPPLDLAPNPGHEELKKYISEHR